MIGIDSKMLYIRLVTAKNVIFPTWNTFILESNSYWWIQTKNINKK